MFLIKVVGLNGLEIDVQIHIKVLCFKKVLTRRLSVSIIVHVARYKKRVLIIIDFINEKRIRPVYKKNSFEKKKACDVVFG